MYNSGIEAFLAVVRTQNVSRAAEQLNLAQSTVSKRLKVLEQEIGTILIERGKGNKVFRLTHAGEAFVDLAERWHTLWRETQFLQSNSPKLSLSIGTLDSMNYAVFPHIYQKLTHHQPKINLRIITSHSWILYDLIERREIDVAFTFLRREHPNIIVEKFHTEPMVGLRIATSSSSQSALIHPHELDPGDELFVYWGAAYQLWHDQWWDPLASDRIYLDTAQLIFSFYSNENQWAIVPLSVARKAQKRGGYDIFQLTEAPPDRICYKLTHKYAKASTLASIEVLDHYLQQLELECLQ